MHALEQDIARYKGRYDQGYEAAVQRTPGAHEAPGPAPAGAELSAGALEWAGVEDKAWEARCMEVYVAMIDCMDRASAGWSMS